MLYVHETHTLNGRHERDFEALFRDEWLAVLAGTDDVRLALYLRHPPVVGDSHTAVTVLACRDATAWQRLQERMRGGDLTRLADRTDGLRRSVTGKLLSPLPGWVQDVAFDEIPCTAGEHAPSLWNEDTLWPFEGRFDEYVDVCGGFTRGLKKYAKSGASFLEPMLGARTSLGSGTGREVVALSRIVDPEAWLRLAIHGLPDDHDLGWDALALRERWRTHVLNVPTWSPIW